MRILHTSDWHLGQHLMANDRKLEHEKFLNWLIDYLSNNPIDVLIVAGDIFDSGTPPNYALRLYYDFLHRIRDTQCSQVLIIGGNHDSVSNLHAPRELLKLFNIQVIGGISGEINKHHEDEIVVVKDAADLPIGIICAVPFLRDRDIRRSMPGETYEEKSRALLEGVKRHYQEVKNRAIQLRDHLTGDTRKIPLIATGHLFASGGQISDGIRDIYVGSLSEIDASSFPDEFDYVALGHLHKPQKVGGCEHIRYSGSPIPLSFSEVGAKKQVFVVSFDVVGGAECYPQIEAVDVPEFQKLCCVRGNLEGIAEKLKNLTDSDNQGKIWIEVQVDSDTWLPEIRNTIMELAEDIPVDILAIKNMRNDAPRHLMQTERRETLQDLSLLDVFEKCLSTEDQMDEKDKQDLRQAFNTIVNAVGNQ